MAGEIEKKIKGRPLIVSISGGKDSTATFLHLTRELGLEVELVHMDTGWEHLDTVDYVRRLPELLGQEITILRDEVELSDELREIAEDLEARYLGGHYSAMVRRTLAKAMFPSRVIRWCTQQLKIFPFLDYAFTKYGRDEHEIGRFVNVVGVRAEESAKRAQMSQWDMDDTGFVIWRPLLAWTEAQVIDIHKRHGIAPNPLYLRGAQRVGCWPCINSRKAEIRQVAESDNQRIALMRELEAILTTRAQKRAEKKGTAPTPRTFFHNPVKGTEDRHAFIDEVVSWSRTNRKGEYEPFAPLPHEAGCTRWGFCDLSWRQVQPPQQDLFHSGGDE